MALPEIANPTIAQLHNIINTNIANDVVGGIDPTDDRAVRNSIINYLSNISGQTLKSKVVVLNTFQLDRNFSIPTTISDGTTIHSVVVSLICKTANNSFIAGDIVTSPTPYPADSGRTAAQGIGVEYNNSDITSIKAMVNDEVTIMSKYNATGGATAGNLSINPAQWSIRLSILYV